MNRLRLVFITRRFWPLVGGAEMNMANLAAALVDAGHQVTIVTAAWNRDWPTEIQHRGVRVHRIPQSSRWMPSVFKYMRGLARWLREHRDEFDLAYVSTLKQDAYVAVAAGRRFDFPVALRAEGCGPTGDSAWQQGSRLGRWVRRQCSRAAAVVAPSPAIEQELIHGGYPADRLQLIPNGVCVAEERTEKRRLLAREALGTAHAVLSLGRDTKLAVYTGRLEEEKGLMCLVEAWARVLKTHSNTRLWLVGEGPLRDRLAEQIERFSIRGRCVLVGSFDSVEELLAAADLFVLPSRDEDASIALLEAMAHGLPIVATDSPGARTLITSGANGLLCPLGDPIALSAAMAELLDSPALAARYGEAAREQAGSQFALSTMVDRHTDLFERLIRATK
jgi:glycosyltransferase involved in cell wall biosynthesis